MSRLRRESNLSDNKSRNLVTDRVNLFGINVEKAVLVYIALAKAFPEDRSKIKFNKYSDKWDDMFAKGSKQDSKDIKIQGFKDTHQLFDGKSLKEIQDYRNGMIIFDGIEIPEYIRKMAKDKGVVVSLAENKSKHLSGFNILVQYDKFNAHRINAIPYGLNEKEVVKKLSDMPLKKELIDSEIRLATTLKDSSIFEQKKIKTVNEYKAPYATHKFAVFMNRFTIHECKNRELIKACCLLCSRVGIKNLMNNAPIEYKYCDGSGQRAKNIKRITARKKGNAKAAQRKSGSKNN